MEKIIGIHAHGSNIPYMERLLSAGIRAKHIIIKPSALATQKEVLMRTIEEHLTNDLTAFLITCTVYAGMIEERVVQGVPILKIEDPIIDRILADHKFKWLFFSNPNTVDLTVKKIAEYYQKRQRLCDYQVVLIPDIFELVMSGQQIAYEQAIKEAIRPYGHCKDQVYLMQLSMSGVGEDPEFQDIKTVFNTAQAVYSDFPFAIE